MSRRSLAVLAALVLMASGVSAWYWLRADSPSANLVLAEAEPIQAVRLEPAEQGQDPALAAPEAMVEHAPALVGDAVARLPAELQQVLSESHRDSAMPPELQQAVSDGRHGSVDPSDWNRQPVQPNLERWRSQAEQDPERAAALGLALRRCAPRGSLLDELEMAEVEWRTVVDRAHAMPLTQDQLETRLRTADFNFASRVNALLLCDGVSEQMARREYIRWLERAGRELPPSAHRDRMRLSFIEEPFPDLPNAADRIGSIDEVLRRRDTARAWLRELRETGVVQAMWHSAVAYSSRGEIEPADAMEAFAWQFVFDVRHAVNAESGSAGFSTPAGRPGAAELWETGVRSASASHRPNQEGLRRGREHYVRIFGAPPD